jgi:hypothetical protein
MKSISKLFITHESAIPLLGGRDTTTWVTVNTAADPTGVWQNHTPALDTA